MAGRPSESPVFWELKPGASSFKSVRIGSSTIAVAGVCLLALAGFSVVDFREVALIQKERNRQTRQTEMEKQQAAFAGWLNEKNSDLNRWMIVIGENPAEEEDVHSASVEPQSGVTVDSSIENIQKTIEQIEDRFHLITDFQSGEEDTFWYVPSVAPVALNEKFMVASAPDIAEGARGGLSGLSSKYGMRVHPLQKQRKMHYGIDIFCPIGSEVKAPANGKVLFAESFKASDDNLKHSYGQFILVQHGDSGIETLYAHLSRILVVKGQIVKRGDLIGYSGDTGAVTAPHLHYEITRNGAKVDPLNYIHDVALVEKGKKIYYVRADKVQKAASTRRRSRI